MKSLTLIAIALATSCAVAPLKAHAEWYIATAQCMTIEQSMEEIIAKGLKEGKLPTPALRYIHTPEDLMIYFNTDGPHVVDVPLKDLNLRLGPSELRVLSEVGTPDPFMILFADKNNCQTFLEEAQSSK
jgi:hypothetical protein